MDCPSSPESIRLSEVKKDLNFELNVDAKLEEQYMPVFARIRPLHTNETLRGHMDCVTVLDDTTIRTQAPIDSVKRKNNNNNEIIEDFTFSKVFGQDVAQVELFEQTLKNTVRGFFEKQNCLVFAYGNSGSGKTFTMQGTPSEPGVIPMTVQLLFELIKGKLADEIILKPSKGCEVIPLEPSEQEKLKSIKGKLLSLFEEEMHDKTYYSCLSMISDISSIDKTSLSHGEISKLENSSVLRNFFQSILDVPGAKYSIWVSFVEIYNEHIFDLLKPFEKKRSHLKLGESKDGNPYVKGLMEICVSSMKEVLGLLQIGQKNLKIASTRLNYQSSRSHCIFSIKLITMDEGSSSVSVNSISFCDLAGSERCSKTESTGLRLKEAGHINTSLHVLGRCISILRENQSLKVKKVIPFRESKLTQLFSVFFCGKGKASMLVNINPSSYTFDETLNVLKFSALAQKIEMIELIMPACSTFLKLSQDWQRHSSLDDTNVDDSSLMEFSNISDAKDQIFDELTERYKALESDLWEEKKRNRQMEFKLRKELAEDFEQRHFKLQSYYEERIQKLEEERLNKVHERMVNILQSIQELDDSASDYSEDESAEEAASTNHAEDTQSPVENSNKTEEPKANGQTAIVDELRESLKHKDEEIKELQLSLVESDTLFETAKSQLKDLTKEIEMKEAKLKDLERSLQENLIVQDTGKSEIEQNKAQVEKVKSELQETLQKLKLREQTIMDLKKSVDDYRAVKEQLECKDQEVVELELYLEETKKRYDNLKSQLETANNVIQLKEVDLEELKKSFEAEHQKATEIDKLKEENQEMLEKISINKIRLQEMEASVDKLNSSCDSAKSDVEKINKLLALKEKEVQEKNIQFEKLNSLYESTKSELAAEKIEATKKDETLQKLSDDIDSFQTEFDGTLAQKVKEVEEKEDEIEQLEKSLDEAETELNEKKQELKTFCEKLDDKISQLKSSEKALEKANTKVLSVVKKLEETKHELKEKSNKVDKLEKLLKDAEDSKTEALAKLVVVQAKFEKSQLDLTLKVDKVKDLLKSANSSSQTEASLQQKTKSLEDANKNLEDLNKRFTTIKSNHDSLQTELQATKDEMTNLKSKLAEKDSQLEAQVQMTESLERLRCSLKEEKSQHAVVQSNFEAKCAELETVQNQLTSQNAQIAELKKTLERLKSENEELSSQLKTQADKINEHSLSLKERELSHLTIKSEVEKNSQKNVELQEQLKSKKDKVDQLEKLLQDSEDSKTETVAKLDAIQTKLDKSKEDLTSKCDKIKELQTTLKTKESLLQKAKKELSAISDQHEKALEQVKSLEKNAVRESEMAALKMEVEVLKLQLASKDEKTDRSDAPSVEILSEEDEVSTPYIPPIKSKVQRQKKQKKPEEPAVAKKDTSVRPKRLARGTSFNLLPASTEIPVRTTRAQQTSKIALVPKESEVPQQQERAKKSKANRKQSDADDFEPQMKKARSTSKVSNVSDDQQKQTNPKKTQTRKNTDKPSSPVAPRRITRHTSSTSVQNIPSSPLNRLKDYVSDKVPKIKAAAQQVVTHLLSPSRSTNVPTKKLKLYSGADEPQLDISPVPDTPKSPLTGEKVTRELRKHINLRRNRKN